VQILVRKKLEGEGGGFSLPFIYQELTFLEGTFQKLSNFKNINLTNPTALKYNVKLLLMVAKLFTNTPD